MSDATSGLLVWLFFLALMGILPAAIAHSKGHNFWLWWFYGMALFIVALIHSIFVGSARRCPHCAEGVRLEANVCPHCQREIAENRELGAQYL